MYLLMTLGEVQDWLDEADFIEEEDFNRLGRHLVSPIRTERQPEYSQQLCDLVYECLNPSIALRPRPANLVRRTRAGMERYKTTSRSDADMTAPPVIRHLNKSKSALPAGGPRAVPWKDVSPQTPPRAINRRIKRPRSGGHEAPPIKISDSVDMLPAERPLEIRDERDGKRRRLASKERSIRGRRKMVINIAGEVIVISDDVSVPRMKSDPPGISNEDVSSDGRRRRRSESPSRSSGSFSLITHPCSRKDHPYIQHNDEEAEEVGRQKNKDGGGEDREEDNREGESEEKEDREEVGREEEDGEEKYAERRSREEESREGRGEEKGG